MKIKKEMISMMGCSRSVTKNRKIELSLAKERVKKVEMPKHEDIPGAKRGIDGLLEADRILQKKEAIGILFGGLAEELYLGNSSEESLNHHKDVDVLVVPICKKKKAHKKFRKFEGGIDWWHSSDISLWNKADVIWKNGHGVQLLPIKGSLWEHYGPIYRIYGDYIIAMMNKKNEKYLYLDINLPGLWVLDLYLYKIFFLYPYTQVLWEKEEKETERFIQEQIFFEYLYHLHIDDIRNYFFEKYLSGYKNNNWDMTEKRVSFDIYVISNSAKKIKDIL